MVVDYLINLIMQSVTRAPFYTQWRRAGDEGSEAFTAASPPLLASGIYQETPAFSAKW